MDSLSSKSLDPQTQAGGTKTKGQAVTLKHLGLLFTVYCTVQFGANYHKTTSTKRHSCALILLQKGSLFKVQTSIHVDFRNKICNNNHYINNVSHGNTM